MLGTCSPTPLEERQADRLRRDVDRLATEIGPRNIHHYEALQKAAAHIETSLTEAGCCPFAPKRGKTSDNIRAELPGREHDEEIVVIGAHCDTHKNSPGANDSASAVAALLELARYFCGPAAGAHVAFLSLVTMRRVHHAPQGYGQPCLCRRTQATSRQRRRHDMNGPKLLTFPKLRPPRAVAGVWSVRLAALSPSE